MLAAESSEVAFSHKVWYNRKGRVKMQWSKKVWVRR